MNAKVVAGIIAFAVVAYLMVLRTGAPLAQYNPLNHATSVSNVTNNTGGGGTDPENDGGAG